GDGPGADGAGRPRSFDPGDDEAVPVAALDLLPGLPTEHRRALDEDDALDRGVEADVEVRAAADPQLLERVDAGERLLCHVVGHLRLELLQAGAEQVVLRRG